MNGINVVFKNVWFNIIKFIIFELIIIKKKIKCVFIFSYIYKIYDLLYVVWYVY